MPVAVLRLADHIGAMLPEPASAQNSLSAMDPVKRAQLKEYVDRWKRVGPLLEAQREEDVRRSDTFSAFSFFAGMPRINAAKIPASTTSGLVEQQLWFRKLHAI